MDYSLIFFQNNTNHNATRRLPTYEEANIPYSLRLPTYRSSYIRRFHPYARYTTCSMEEQYMVQLLASPPTHLFFLTRKKDDSHGDHREEETPLDLRILEDPAQVFPTLPAEERTEEQRELPADMLDVEEARLIVSLDIRNADLEEEYGAAEGRGRLSIFYRANVDIVQCD
ncbi:hypothetical protein AX15_006405 [Amanita polypyramis BW_CC]|nr:hypothetical protein AX15_006405 [Amanita polypyramis BW_CC]